MRGNVTLLVEREGVKDVLPKKAKNSVLGKGGSPGDGEGDGDGMEKGTTVETGNEGLEEVPASQDSDDSFRAGGVATAPGGDASVVCGPV
jgi:hypothetical protein